MRRLLAVLLAVPMMLVLPSCGETPPVDPCEIAPELCQPPAPPGGYDCDAEAPRGIVQLAGLMEAERWIVVLDAPTAQERASLGVLTVQARATALAAELELSEVSPLELVGPHGGFVARASAQVVAALARRAGIRYVQPDGRKTIGAIPYSNDRSNERQRVIDDDESTGDGADGNGIHVMVADTGVMAHPEYEDRLSPDCFTAHVFGGCDGLHDHAPHVASNIVGITFGIAKAAIVHSVRVLDEQGRGSDSDVIRGIEWATSYCVERGLTCVGNMSLGGSPSPALDAALCASIRAGVAWAVAAGNDGRDACSSSPARVRQALTVGAIDQGDRLAGFSNRGPCVDVLAVGAPTRGAVRGGGERSMQGTSMASPEAAAVLVLEAQRDPSGSPADWIAALLERATDGVVAGVPSDTPDRLIYSRRD